MKKTKTPREAKASRGLGALFVWLESWLLSKTGAGLETKEAWVLFTTAVMGAFTATVWLADRRISGPK